jgi:hypothetical protein
MKSVWTEELFAHETTALHENNHVPELGDHRQVAKDQSRDGVPIGRIVLRRAGYQLTYRTIIKSTLPTVAAVSTERLALKQQWLLAKKQISGSDIGGRRWIGTDGGRVHAKRALRDDVLQVKAFLRQQATTNATHKRLRAGDFWRVRGEVMPHFVPQLFPKSGKHQVGHAKQPLRRRKPKHVAKRILCDIHYIICQE